MKITPKWEFCEGNFDTKEVEMVCIPSDNHGQVTLNIREKGHNTSFGIAKIRLHSKDLYVDFKETFADATALGNEIARRWNECENKL
jgi:hypothetical protein